MKPHRASPIALLVPIALTLTSAASVLGGEKSGVEPTVVSLPGGPGSIEGLGESFEPMLQTGTARTGLPIRLPAGVAGHQPALRLVYEGGSGNGALGFGWSLGVPMVRRQVERGVPRYHLPGGGEEDTFLGSDGTELVQLKNGFYLARLAGGFLRWRRVYPDRQNHPERFSWEARTKNGVKLEFGLTESSRIASPAAGSADGRERIACWCLERETDLHGNVIEYRYSDLGRPEDRQKYRVEIRYGPGAPPWDTYNFVALAYEDRPDSFSDGRRGFLVRTSRRLKSIVVGIHGADPQQTAGCLRQDLNGDGFDDALIRRYELAYEGHRHWSLLTRVSVLGSDGVNYLPPAAYRYGQADDRLDEERRIEIRERDVVFSLNEPALLDDHELVELIDLNADGLPDLLRSDQRAHTGSINLGVGEGESPRLRWSDVVEPTVEGFEIPESLEYSLDLSGVHLADMDADGLADLVVAPAAGGGEDVRYYRNLGTFDARCPDGGGSLWGEAVDLVASGEIPPSPFDPGRPRVKTFDINFDKRMDVVESSRNGYRIWINEGDGGYSAPLDVDGAVHRGVVLEFDDRRVTVADLNGDRMVDVARLESDRVAYAVSLGRGRFAAAVEMELLDGAILNSAQLDRADLRDVNGDGLADLVVERASGDDLWYWVNLGTDSWSRRRVLTGMPGLPGGAQTGWADMNGSGTVDLVFSGSGLPDGARIRFVEIGVLIEGGACPRQLVETDNGLGLRTAITYRSSVEYACEAREAGHPWTVSNPNPVKVVASVALSTGLDLDGVPGKDIYRTDFVYRDGYYDAVRRQFCGFGFVKRIVRGDDSIARPEGAPEISAPTLVERHRFHTGAADGVDNDGDGEIDEHDGWMGREEEALKGVTLWIETTSLPDDPILDGEHSPDTRVFERSESPLTTWEVRGVAMPAGGGLEKLFGAGYRTARTDRCVLLAVQRQVDRFVIEEGRGPSKHLRETTEVDAIGQPIVRREYSDLERDDDDRTTQTEYTRREDLWILSPPSRVRVRAGGPDGAFVSETRTYYDGEPFVGLPLGQLGDRSLPHRTETFISEPQDWEPKGEPLPEITEMTTAIGDPRLPGASVDAQRSEFDVFGNAIALLDANANRREVVYETTLRTYPVREVVFTGEAGGPLAMNARYHLGYGVVVQSFDYNGNRSDYRYDVFGRPTAVVRPRDTEEHPSSLFEYRHANPQPLAHPTERVLYEYDAAGKVTVRRGDVSIASSVITRARETAGGGTFDAISYVDGAGRALATLEESDTAGRSVVKTAVTYNLRGLPRQTFQPHEKGSLEYSPPDGSTAPHADSFYDALGRGVRGVTPPDAHGARHQTRTVYRPFQVDAWDAEDTLPGGRHAGTYHSTFSDGLGRTVRVIERNPLDSDFEDPATEYRTVYTWSLQDKIVTILDALGNVKYQRHDGLGRKFFMSDLDCGHRFYTYDAGGNLVDFVDAREQRTVYTYDSANRLLTRNYLDQTGDRATDPVDVFFTYDVPARDVDFGDHTRGDSRNPRGQLVSVRDLSGEETTSFDERGRVEWTAKVIPDPVTAISVAYTTRIAYDSLDRVTELIYPDNDRVTYSYNARSLFHSVRGGNAGAEVVSSMRYRPSGQVEEMVLGNGVRSEYRYDPRLRLTELRTDGAGATAGRDLIRYAYRFDATSNITSIADLRAHVAAGDPRHNSQRFEYDDLYRLTRFELVDSTLAPESLRGRIDYRYDRNGSLLFKGSPTEGPGHIEKLEKGKSGVNLGGYSYAGGRKGRFGRKAGDPPGPHAVTGTESGRSYGYDANGNASSIDGSGAEWDFLNRLARLVGPQHESEYVYDYMNRRVVKSTRRRGTGARADVVVYVNKHFEVREADAPVKYVFADEGRVARVTGTLDPKRPRIQRLRFAEGWNFVGLAVTPDDRSVASVFSTDGKPVVSAVFRAVDGKFSRLSVDDEIGAGHALWVLADRPAVVTVVGRYDPAPPPVRLPAGSHTVGWARLTAAIPSEIFSQAHQVWVYRAGTNSWGVEDFTVPEMSNLDGQVPVGAGLVVFAQDGTLLDAGAGRAREIVFYHSDHLGSANILTDAEGELIEETAFLPHGLPRNTERREPFEGGAYSYTDHERDAESGLYYLGARYRDPSLGRFVSADPYYVEGGNQGNPRLLDPYAYVANNPIRYVDPTGLEIETRRAPGTDEGDAEFYTNNYIDEARGLFGIDLVSQNGTIVTADVDQALRRYQELRNEMRQRIDAYNQNGRRASFQRASVMLRRMIESWLPAGTSRVVDGTQFRSRRITVRLRMDNAIRRDGGRARFSTGRNARVDVYARDVPHEFVPNPGNEAMLDNPNVHRAFGLVFLTAHEADHNTRRAQQLPGESHANWVSRNERITIRRLNQVRVGLGLPRRFNHDTVGSSLWFEGGRLDLRP